MSSEFSFDQDTAIGGETAHTSNWDSCRSSTPLASQDSSQNPGNLAVSKAGRPTLPRRGYRWNLCQNPSQTSLSQEERENAMENSSCPPYPFTPRSVNRSTNDALPQFEQDQPAREIQRKRIEEPVLMKRCGKNGMYFKEERPTTWSYAAAPRGSGMPPPERMVRPRYALDNGQNQVNERVLL